MHGSSSRRLQELAAPTARARLTQLPLLVLMFAGLGCGTEHEAEVGVGVPVTDTTMQVTPELPMDTTPAGTPAPPATAPGQSPPR
jgi:hypothetical protein